MPAGPDDGARGRSQPRRGPRSRALVLAVAVALVLAGVATVLGVLLVRAGGDDLDELRTAAGEFGEALVTYDHEDPDAHRDAVLDRATGSFAGEYEEAFDRGLGELITDLEATSQGFVKDVYVTEVDRGQALAIVVMDIENDGSGGPRTLFDVYVRLTMIEVDGTWLVDDVTDLSFGSGAGIGAGVTEDTAPTTATSVP